MTRITSYSVPAELWNALPRAQDGLDVIQDLTQDLIALHRRLAKRVNEDAERERFHQTCELLEVAVHAAARNASGRDRFAQFANDHDYFEYLSQQWLTRIAHSEEGPAEPIGHWIGPSVIPPEAVQFHVAALRKDVDVASRFARRLDFLSRAMREGAGIVECLEQQVQGDTPNLTTKGALRLNEANQVQLDQQGRVDVASVFRQRVEQALRDGTPVNMNNQNHVVITQILAEFLLKCKEHPPGQIRVAYGDGSEARPFPLCCLKPADPNKAECIVPVSLMSMRHLLLDQCVVRNWLRNREIDQDSTLARGDIYCYRHAVSEFLSLKSSLSPGERLLVKLYHTGYEPAVVGVYRAAVEAMCDGSDWLRIVPHYYVAPGFIEGPSWPPLA